MMLDASISCTGLPATHSVARGEAAPPFRVSTVVIEGDGITSALPSAPSNDFYSYRYAESRPDLAIAVRAQEGRVIGTAANLDDGGNSLIGKVAEDMAYEPDLITALIGAHDISTGSAVTYKATLIAWHAAVKARRPGCRVAWSAPLPYNPDQSQSTYASFTAQRAIVMADARDPAVWGQWADYYLPLAEHPDWAEIGSALYADSMHPTAFDAVNGMGGQNRLYDQFAAALDSIADATRINANAPYGKVWPEDEDGLATEAQLVRRFVISGIAHKGLSSGVSVSGGEVRLNGGAYGTRIGRIYNGDVIDLRLTTSAEGETATVVTLTIGGETREIGYTTAAGAGGEVPPKVLSEGDSISASTDPASFTRLWAADHPTVVYANHAVGGAQLGFTGDTLPANTLYARQADALAYEPTHLVLLIGANDLAGDTTAYVSRLYAYLAPFKAAGTTIVLCTVLPRDSSGWQDKMDAFNARLRLDEGTEFDFLVDFATSEAGAWGAQLDTALYGDGLHPTAAGHALLKRVFAPVINHALGIPNEPLDFAFEPQAAADADTDYDSAPYAVAGLYPGETRPYSVSAGGAISRNGGAYVIDGAGFVVNGDTISVRNHSSTDPAVQTDVTAIIGTSSATYSVTTAGAGSRLWVPSDLGSKLALWLRPEDILGDDGDEIDAWTDSSGNAVAVPSAGSSSKPRIKIAALNGFKVVNMDGVRQGHFTLPTANLDGRSTSATFFVSKNSFDPNTRDFAPPVGRFGTDGSGEFYPYTTGDIYSAYGTNTRYRISAARPGLAEWRFASFQSAANDWRYYVDGSVIHALIANTVAFGTTPAIGAGYYNDYFDGQIAEVIDCNEALTTTERQRVEGYLAWKFGLESNLPGEHPYASAAPTI